jgi:PPOX class probable F420-dependent enzyme
MASIPSSHVDLLESDAVAVFGTINPDGTPLMTPVWVGHDGDDVLVNSARGRLKVENAEREPAAGVCVMDPEDPYRYLSVWGQVVEVTEAEAEAHIHELSRRYTGTDYDLSGESTARVVLRLRPEGVSSW